MEIKKKQKQNAIRFSAMEGKEELGSAHLYLIQNESHKEPYGFLEDVLVKEEHRKKGIGTALVKEAIAEAKRLKCYKLLGTSRLSRENVHAWYEKLGLKKWGYEFRMDL